MPWLRAQPTRAGAPADSRALFQRAGDAVVGVAQICADSAEGGYDEHGYERSEQGIFHGCHTGLVANEASKDLTHWRFSSPKRRTSNTYANSGPDQAGCAMDRLREMLN